MIFSGDFTTSTPSIVSDASTPTPPPTCSEPEPPKNGDVHCDQTDRLENGYLEGTVCNYTCNKSEVHAFYVKCD